MGLKKFFEDIEPQFEKGGKFETWYALYEAVGSKTYHDNSMASGFPCHVLGYVQYRFSSN